jgi:CheY-like chemotaxis protein
MKKTFDLVYLIDDDLKFSFITKTLLSKISFAKEIVDYSDASEALEQLKKNTQNGNGKLPDIIFLDLNMPGMDGWDFLEEYKSLPASFRQKCKLYLLTSSIDPVDKNKSQSYTFVSDFISKPLARDKVNWIQENN